MPLYTFGGQIIARGSDLAAGINCCCCGGCNGTAPDQLSIVLASIAAGTCGCSNCTNLNGTYVLDYQPADSDSSNCVYASSATATTASCPGDPPGTSFKRVTATIGKDMANNYFMTVTLLRGPSGNVNFVMNIWHKVFGSTKPTCSNFSSLDVPYNFTTGCPLGSLCDGSSSTCLATAV